MAQDMIVVMERLGFARFCVAGHDRGGRTVHRMCMDHPECVIKVCLMDIIPNHYVWTNPTKAWVRFRHPRLIYEMVAAATLGGLRRPAVMPDVGVRGSDSPLGEPSPRGVIS